MRSRRLVPELMDDPELPEQQHALALRGLARINRATRIDGVFWRAIQAEMRRVKRRPLHLLDVASGGGDLLARLAGRAVRAGLPLCCHACDVSPTALAITRRKWPYGDTVPLNTIQQDVRAPLPRDFDIVTCSLFLHHLTNEDVVTVLKSLKRHCQSLLLIDDLLRTRRGLMLAWIGSRLLSRSHVVHVDAPRSVRAGWTVAEMLDLCQLAGLDSAAISRHWPERFLLRWSPV